MKLLRTETLLNFENYDRQILEVWEYNPIYSGWDYINPENHTPMADYTEKSQILEIIQVAYYNGIQPRELNDITGWLEYTLTDLYDIDRETTFTLFPSNCNYPGKEQELKCIEGILNQLMAGYDLDELDR